MSDCPRRGQPLDPCAVMDGPDAIDEAGQCATCGVAPRETVVYEVRQFTCCLTCTSPGACAEGDRCAQGVGPADREIERGWWP